MIGFALGEPEVYATRNFLATEIFACGNRVAVIGLSTCPAQESLVVGCLRHLTIAKKALCSIA